MVALFTPKRPTTNFHIKYAGEEFQFSFRQHWIRLIWPLMRLVVWNTLIIGMGYTIFFLVGISDPPMRHAILSVLMSFFLLAHLEFVSRIYKYLLYIVIVTDKKIHRIKKTLLTLDDHQSIDIWMLQDIHKCQHGVVQNLFGFGTLILEAQETTMRLHFTPHISEKYTKMLHIRERARISMIYPQKFAQRRADTAKVTEKSSPIRLPQEERTPTMV